MTPEELLSHIYKSADENISLNTEYIRQSLSAIISEDDGVIDVIIKSCLATIRSSVQISCAAMMAELISLGYIVPEDIEFHEERPPISFRVIDGGLSDQPKQ